MKLYNYTDLCSARNCSCVYTCRLVLKMYTASAPPEHKSAYTYMHSLVLESALEFSNTPLPMIGLSGHRKSSRTAAQLVLVLIPCKIA